MSKLNRPHGIEVGSKVKVIDGSGAARYREHVGKILTVGHVSVHNSVDNGSNDMISCEEVDGAGMYAFRFSLVVDKTNGVNKDGERIEFKDADLKPFQRVKLKNGKRAIVSVNNRGVIALTFGPDDGGGWTEATVDNPDHGSEWNIVRVHNPDYHWNAFDTTVNGDLVWKLEPTKEEAEAAAIEAAKQATRDAELAKLQAVIDAAIAARDAFEATN